MHTHSHPSARELHAMLQRKRTGISLATVYNSLHYLLQHGLVNEHRTNGIFARYCTNHPPHMHLLDTKSGRLVDISLKPGVQAEDVFELPDGAQITGMKVYLSGTIPE